MHDSVLKLAFDSETSTIFIYPLLQLFGFGFGGDFGSMVHWCIGVDSSSIRHNRILSKKYF